MAREPPHLAPGANVRGKSAAMRPSRSPFWLILTARRAHFPAQEHAFPSLVALLELLGST
jgi:hypothetical protein